MSAHDPDRNPSLDEIESLAAVAAHFWLDEADKAADQNLADQKRAPAAMAGFQIAAASHYQAERHVDAAERIAAGLRDLASAIREARHATEEGLREPLLIERLAGIESELYRLAEIARGGPAGWLPSAGGRSDGGK